MREFEWENTSSNTKDNSTQNSLDWQEKKKNTAFYRQIQINVMIQVRQVPFSAQVLSIVQLTATE